jgi:hypothetical protein
LLAEQRFAEVAPSEIPIMETWYIEKEDGSRPVHFVSSNGVKIEIPRATTP